MGEPRMLIDGKLVEGSEGRVFDNVNPATEEVLGQVADGTAADMEAAVAAARRAFDTTWWATDHQRRKAAILQLQAAIEKEVEELRAELVAEVGCPVLATYGPQLDAPLREALTWPAEMIDEFPWSRSLGPKDSLGIGNSEREVWKEPIGVVGVIVPWNFPIEIILNKLGPVLAMGNTCVLKPAPDTPWNATRLGRLVAEHTDIPPGVVNVVTSSDHLVGEGLSTSPLVDMVAFTGSTATGRRIMAAAAATLKPVFLELGGKSVNLILDDADLAGAMAGAGFTCFHAGQGCAISTRLLVPRVRYDEAVELATEAFRGVTYGDPTDPGNIMGPLVSARQRERVLGYIESAREQGARVAVGGGRPAHLDKGWYVEPTLLVDVDNSMTVAQEEIFGPVLVVIPYEDEDDAVRIANDSEYGLSGMISSADLDRAKAVARRIRTGTLGLNGGVWYGADAPFGGYKQSGIGRQCGLEGLEIFTETKTVGWPA
ncbi:MAG TPA: aldehyde dehydrogenase family protein [Acidimicrobiales bacterium]|nr:aldehyde dehydrogenase family protein [Acidimicrobiales bacterium]